MLSWTVKKQLLYLCIVLLFTAGAGFLIWSGINKPTCFDGKQNGEEQGIDCGGKCQKECLGDVKKLIVKWNRAFKTGEGKYDVVALVENPNLTLAVKSLKYQFKLYDSNNVLLVIREGKTFLNPGETYLVFETNVDVGKRVPANTQIELEENIGWEKIAKNPLNLLISKKEFFNTAPFPRLVASVDNNALSAVENVSAAAVLYDVNGNAVGASVTKIDSIPSGGLQEAIFTWPSVFGEEPASSEIIFRTEGK